MTINITYNGNVIASLSAGQTVTLECAGQKMVGDIVIAFNLAGSITYNGVQTAINAGKVVTLGCAGQTMASNLIVTAATDESGGDDTGGSGSGDCVSPTIAVSTIVGGHKVTITDVNGTRFFDVMDGKDGTNGKDGANGADGKDGNGVKNIEIVEVN